MTIREAQEAGGIDARSTALIGDILTASARSVGETMDRLYENERRRRQMLEVLIDQTLDAAEQAFGGTVREYEACLDRLRYGAKDALADLHDENRTKP